MNGESSGSGGASAPEVPWLGVHVLSEFTFCPRAGLIAMGQERTDWGDDYWLRPNLDYRPSYALYELRRETVAACLLSATLGIGLVVVLAGCVWLLIHDNNLPLVGGVLLLLVLAVPLSRNLARLTALMSQWKRIHSLTPREPDPTVAVPQPVIWWEMLRAGYDPVRLPDSIRSPTSRLVGHPWRVLRKGDLQIPVFRVEGDDQGRLYPKHAVRAAAYCALLEQATGARSPYAIAALRRHLQRLGPSEHPRSAFLLRSGALRRTVVPLAGSGDRPPEIDDHLCGLSARVAPSLPTRRVGDEAL